MIRSSLNFNLLLLLILFSQKTFSSHIIGGEMHYDCLGYGNSGKDTTTRRYLITIKLYRDCSQNNNAPFDQSLGFTIFRQSGNNYINMKTGINPEYTTTVNLPNDLIPPPAFPCLALPPNICGEAKVYQLEVELPIITDKYVIVWQRCCRNKTITNILDPGNTGATFTIEIHPESQRTCNSSPQFRNFPPTVLCTNAPFKFDHSAIDKEGDQLIYSFCEPLKGGGPNNNGNECDNPNPRPDCAPPFSPVDYVFPYAAVLPLGGNPPITIGSSDGIITGTPNAIGQFVVSVCVHEYRNGVLLSVLKRDFQFNSLPCEKVFNVGKDFKQRGLIAKFKGISEVKGFWRKVSGSGNVVFQNPNDPQTRLRVNEYGIYCFVWDLDDTSCLSRDTICIEFYKTISTDPKFPTKLFDDRSEGLDELISFPIEVVLPTLISPNGITYMNVHCKQNSLINYSWYDLFGRNIFNDNVRIGADWQQVKIQSPVQNGFYYFFVVINDSRVMKKIGVF